jgi:hypothetical protein
MNIMNEDLGPDIEVAADDWEAEQAALASEVFGLDTDLSLDDLDEVLALNPLIGVTLDAKQVFETKDGRVVDSTGRELNSCDFLRIIDGDDFLDDE